MLELKSKALAVRFSALGAKIEAVHVGGVDVIVGPGSDRDALAYDSYTGSVTGRHAGRITAGAYDDIDTTHADGNNFCTKCGKTGGQRFRFQLEHQ